VTPTRNANITLLRIGNLYSIEPGQSLACSVAADMIHFVRKHGTPPKRILVHPSVIGEVGTLEVVSKDNGDVYRARVESDPAIGKKTYLIEGDALDKD
jgi:hypothetical protein